VDIRVDSRGSRIRALRRTLALSFAVVIIAGACASGAGTTATSPSAKASAAAAPTTSAPRTPVTLRLAFLPGWQDAAMYLALDRGYYRDAGLDVTILDGTGSNTTGQVIAAGSDTFGSMSLPAMLLLVDKGAKLQAIGGYLQKIPEAVISLSTSGIKTPKDLEGKRWGYTAGSSGENLFPIFASKNKVDINKITKVNMAASAKLQALLLGQVDFVTDWQPNTDPVIIAAGKTPSSMSFAENGVDVLGQGFVASLDTITNRPDVVKRFMEATVKGINAAVADPDAAAAAVIANRSAMADQRAGLVAGVKGLKGFLHTPNSASLPVGHIATADMASTVAEMRQWLGLQTDLRPATLFTNDLLPK
jgi:NitT/TauT family transport system substrate-binding protein